MRTAQTSFSKGEIAPGLHARVDVAAYLSGLKTCRNFFVRPFGGVANRAGTRLIRNTRQDGRTRLETFRYSAEQTYGLVFADQALWLLTDGGTLEVEPTDAAITNGDFTSGTTGWSDVSTGSAAPAPAAGSRLVDRTQGTAIGDMTGGGGLAAAWDGAASQPWTKCAVLKGQIAHVGRQWGSGKTRKVTRFRLHGSKDWGLKTGPAGQSIRVAFEGSSDNFVDSVDNLWVGYVKTAPGQILDVDEGIDPVAYRYHRFRLSMGGDSHFAVAEVELYEAADTGSDPGAGGAPVGRLRLVGDSDGVAWSEQAVTTTKLGQWHVLRFASYGAAGANLQLRIGNASKGDEILADLHCPPGLHSIGFVPTRSPFYVGFRNPALGTIDVDAVSFLNSGGTAPVPFLLSTRYREAELFDIGHVQSHDVVTLVHNSHPPRELRRLDHLSWQLVDIAFAPSLRAPSGAAAAKVGSHTSGTTTHSYVVTAERTERPEESLPSSVASVTNGLATLTATDAVDVSWVSTGADRYNVYKLRNGLYGYIGSSETTAFRDDGISPKVDDTPPKPRSPFAGAGNYPAAVGYFDDRQVFASTLLAPDTVWLSKTGAYRNFTVSQPFKDDDAITFACRSVDGQGSVIRHVGGLRSLLLLSTAAEFRVDRGENGLTPALSGGVRPQSFRGASKLRPIAIGDGLVYVEEQGSTVRDLRYDALKEGYASTELSLLSHHLLTGRRVVDWCYAQHPDQLLWLVLDNGRLLSLTYLDDQEVVGWARHDTRGTVESVCAVYERGEHAVYMVVRRRIAGEVRRFIERMARRRIDDVRDAFFVDCGLTLDAPMVIENVTRGEFAVAIEVPGLEVQTGDYIDIDGTGGSTELNGRRFRVGTVTAGGEILLRDQYSNQHVSPAGIGAWTGGGLARKAVKTVTGLGHLEGEEVAILADGGVETAQTVRAGQVTLARAASRVHVGLPYSAELVTLSIATIPEIYGKRKAVKQVQLFVDATRGLQVGNPTGLLDEQPPREAESWDEPTRPFTGLVEITIRSTWSDGGQVRALQRDPLPAEVLAILPVFELGS